MQTVTIATGEITSQTGHPSQASEHGALRPYATTVFSMAEDAMTKDAMPDDTRHDALQRCVEDLRRHVGGDAHSLSTPETNPCPLFTTAANQASGLYNLPLLETPVGVPATTRNEAQDPGQLASSAHLAARLTWGDIQTGQIFTEEQIQQYLNEATPDSQWVRERVAEERARADLTSKLATATTVNDVLDTLGPKYGPLGVAISCAAVLQRALWQATNDARHDQPDFGTATFTSLVSRVLALLEAARLLCDSINSADHVGQTARERDRLNQLLQSYHEYLTQSLSAYEQVRRHHHDAIAEIEHDMTGIRREDTRRDNLYEAAGLISTIAPPPGTPARVTARTGRRQDITSIER